MTLKLIKKAKVFTPDYLGVKDILMGGGRILGIENDIHCPSDLAEIIPGEGKNIFPGLIDQHVHLTGAGGKHSFSSMTSEVNIQDLISCGTTTVVGLLGTDGTTRSLQRLYAKVKSLDEEGLTAYMLTGYYGLPSLTITHSVQDDLIFIDKVIGCKVAMSDIRSSFPTRRDILQLLQQIHTGGLLSGKGGILHVHIGDLESRMMILFDIVTKDHFPIQKISPTHVGRTKKLFEDAIKFAKMGGIIDITTGVTHIDEPYRQVLYALEKGVSIDQMSFSSDGHAGITTTDSSGKRVLNQAPLHQNLNQVQLLIRDGGLSPSQAFKLITKNPAKNLSLHHKGIIRTGADADFCFFDDDFELTDVLAKGVFLMKNQHVPDLKWPS
jgi:beta-aspartyl-dipeptidase (metallo-type)